MPKEQEFTFEKGLQAWVKATSQSKDLARALAEHGLKHFHDHGDVVKLQTLLDTFQKHGKNYVRIAAFEKWLQAHSPIHKEGGKYKKKKDGQWDDAVYQKAFETPFWDFAPDPENVMWGSTDVVKALTSAIHRFEKDNYAPKDEAAMKKLEQAKAAIATLG